MSSIIAVILLHSFNFYRRHRRRSMSISLEGNRLVANEIESKWSARDTFYQQIASSRVVQRDEKKKSLILEKR